MPTIYSRPELFDPVLVLLGGVMGRSHQDLEKAEVRVGVLFAANPDGPALKSSKYPVLARIRVVSHMWRTVGCPDALLEIDEEKWQELEEDQREALIDHELSHLTLVKHKETGEVKRDDGGRPRLRTVTGDWNGTDGFEAVVLRHGEAALEFDSARRCFGLAKAAAEATEEQPA